MPPVGLGFESGKGGRTMEDEDVPDPFVARGVTERQGKRAIHATSSKDTPSSATSSNSERAPFQYDDEGGPRTGDFASGHARSTTGGTRSTVPTTPGGPASTRSRAAPAHASPPPPVPMPTRPKSPPPITIKPQLTDRSVLGDWAPYQPPASSPSSLPQLPDFLRDHSVPTSTHIQPSQIVREMDESTAALLSPRVLEQLMTEPLARHRFREYLQRAAGDVQALDLYTDVTAYKAQSDKTARTATALHDILGLPTSTTNAALAPSTIEELLNSLRSGINLFDSIDTLDQVREILLQALWQSDFNSFIRNKLIEEARVVLGHVDLPGSGLGDCYCLTNPRLRDNPIVLVSPGFERLTGYAAREILGRNCRMLAGPATSPMGSQRIREACSRGEGITLLLLNYRRTGVPFWNLVEVVPLRDAAGNLCYFLGCQTEVTGAVASARNLSWLVGSHEDPSGAIDPSEEYSPALRAYAAGLATHPAPSSGPSSAQSAAHRRPSEVVIPGVRDRVNPYTGSAPKPVSRWKSLLQSLGVPRQDSPSPAEARRRQLDKQQIGGAEALFSKDKRPVEMQLDQFSKLYSRLIVFRRATREILFVTADLLDFCGLPHTTVAEQFASPLLHVDILDLLAAAAPKHADFKRMRRALKSAIDDGIAISLECGVKARCPPDYELLIKRCTLHVSPLHDRDGTVEAFVAVFG